MATDSTFLSGTNTVTYSLSFVRSIIRVRPPFVPVVVVGRPPVGPGSGDRELGPESFVGAGDCKVV